jgi:hypothetical protein
MYSYMANKIRMKKYYMDRIYMVLTDSIFQWWLQT